MNRQDITAKALDPSEYVAWAGRVNRRALSALQREVTARAGPEAGRRLLSSLSRVPEGQVAFYSYLRKSMPYKHSFGQETTWLGRGYEQGDPPAYRAFGIHQFGPSDPQEVAVGEQVRIIHHRYILPDGETVWELQQRYVVELLTTSARHRLLLAQIDPDKTLGATVARVMALCEKPNTAVWEAPAAEAGEGHGAVPVDPDDRAAVQKMMDKMSSYRNLTWMENLTVPVIDLDLMARLAAFDGRVVENTKRRVQGLPIEAWQQVRFRLDRHGAEVESEAKGTLFCGPPRDFDFVPPFLVLIVDGQTKSPVMALWVSHPEILVRAEE
jgi:hypothetical protein